jgi:hypothetical protein
LASAFFALEIPHMDGAEFALEAYSACVVAGVVGTIVGHCIWEPPSSWATVAFGSLGAILLINRRSRPQSLAWVPWLWGFWPAS